MSKDQATKPSPGRRLREAWAAQTIAVPGVFNALVARMAEGLGFRAAYLSGGALSAAAGVPDIGLLSLNDFVDQARTITLATSLPLLSDADTGFGEALNVERTVRLFEAAGVAGIHLEDQQMPKRCGHLSGKSLVGPEVMAAKLRAAAAARRDPDFVLIARTDARGVTGLDDAVRRARLYLEAGADAIFPEALESADEFARFAREVKAPLLANMTEFGKGPLLDFDTLAGLGYRMVLYPLTAFRAAMRAARDTLAELLEKGHQRDRVPQMLTRAELYDLLGYTSYEARDRAYFGGTEGVLVRPAPGRGRRLPAQAPRRARRG
jgi:methylisocitrate lyase